MLGLWSGYRNKIVETIKEVPQERLQQRTVEHIVRVPVPQIQESIVKGVKVIPQERFPERTVEQNEDIPVPQAFLSDSHVSRHDGRVASLLERLDEFGKRLDLSLARENVEMIKEIEKLLEEKRAIDGAQDFGAGGVRSGGSRLFSM